MKYTVNEIEEIIKADNINGDNKYGQYEDYSEVYEVLYEEQDDIKVGDLIFKFEDSGGAEGDGALKWIVFKVGDQLFKMTGYYSSWSDGEWDGELEEVKPVRVMRTEYEAV